MVLTANNSSGFEAYGGSVSGSIDNITVREILGSHAKQSAVAAKPSVQQVGGRNVINFDGNNDFLQTGITTGNEGWVCAGVSSPNTNSTYFCSGAGNNAQKGIWLYRTAANNRLNFLVGDGVTVYSNGNSLTIPVNVPTVVDGGWDATTNMIAVDGVEAATPRTNGSASPSPALLRLGAYTDGVAYPLNGAMTAAVYTPVLPSEADRKIIRKGIAALQGRRL